LSLALFEIFAERRSQGGLQELDLWHTAFADDADMLSIEVHVIYVHANQFGKANAGAEEQLENDPVAACQRVGAVVKLLEEPAFLGLRQILRRPP